MSSFQGLYCWAESLSIIMSPLRGEVSNLINHVNHINQVNHGSDNHSINPSSNLMTTK